MAHPLWKTLLSQAEALARELDAMHARRIVITVDRTNVLDRPWQTSSPKGLRALLAELAECWPAPREVEIRGFGEGLEGKRVARVLQEKGGQDG